jgi:predicted metal-dependent hydrolase
MNKPLFAYTLRESPRAKYVRLKVSSQHGLEVIVPAGYDRGQIPEILDRKKAWIRTALDRAKDVRKFFEPQPSWQLPTQIHLRAIGRVVHVEAKEREVPWVAVRETGPDTVEISGCISDRRTCRLALTRWLARQTREHLSPRLQALSAKMGLKYQQVFVKHQKTRWASCSKRRNISLNLKLLFLPPELVDYVLIHELCHIVELNHSRRFWATVERHCPDYRRLNAQVREMWKVVPQWAASSKP